MVFVLDVDHLLGQGVVLFLVLFKAGVAQFLEVVFLVGEMGLGVVDQVVEHAAQRLPAAPGLDGVEQVVDEDDQFLVLVVELGDADAHAFRPFHQGHGFRSSVWAFGLMLLDRWRRDFNRAATKMNSVLPEPGITAGAGRR